MGAYDEQWKRYRRLKLAFVLSNAGFLAFAVPTFLLAKFGKPEWANFTFFGLGTAWFACYAVSYDCIRRFPCPRCGRRFSSSWRKFLDFSGKQCLHCGLKRFSDEE
jgi:hypothetical protein